jgi:PRC-barrel domain
MGDQLSDDPTGCEGTPMDCWTLAAGQAPALRAALAACGTVLDVPLNGWHARRILPAASTQGRTTDKCDVAERKASVFEAANIREWRGHDVVDSGDHKIGELEAVYVDTSTDLPSFGTVKVGMPTRHRLVFVPLAQAAVGPGYLKVAYDKKQVNGTPSIGTDSELPAADEEAIFKHYGLTYQPGASGERRLARR